MITPFFDPIPWDSMCSEEAGLAAARALQNSGLVESMAFGKVHFAQEPSKTEDSATSTLKSRALTHTEWEGGELKAGCGPPVGPGSLWCQAPQPAQGPQPGHVGATGSILKWLCRGSDPLRGVENIPPLRNHVE